MTVDDTGSGTGAHPAPDGEPGRTAGSATDPAPAAADADLRGDEDAGDPQERSDPNARSDRNLSDTPSPPPDPQGRLDGQGRLDAQNRLDEQAADSGEDPLALRLEGLILGAERRYTPFQAARSAGVSMELASRFWRAMGFADIGQAKALTEADVLALRRLAGLVEAGLLSEAMAVQVARSTGQTTARLAEWQIDSFLEGLTEPPNRG